MEIDNGSDLHSEGYSEQEDSDEYRMRRNIGWYDLSFELQR